MSRMLASVNCLEEALLVQQLGASIIDMKQPAKGALGALPVDVVTDIVRALGTDTTTSATIGDLPMHPELVVAAVLKMASSGVSFVKLGIFADGDVVATLQALSPYSDKLALIAVLFADQPADFALIPAIAEAGFRGVMLDTQNKSSGRLSQILRPEQLKQFVDNAKAQQLLCGLAGSLRLSDLDYLNNLGADYLGFRGGLCHEDQRTAQLDPNKIKAIQQALAAA